MSLIKIPDGNRTPLIIESVQILAVRDAGDNKTWIFFKGEDDGWKIDHPINSVIALIPFRD